MIFPMKIKPARWDSIFRNRRGAVCAVCSCLVFVVVVMVGTWSLCCIADDWTLKPLPDGTTPLVAVILGCQFFKYRDDRLADAAKPSAS